MTPPNASASTRGPFDTTHDGVRLLATVLTIVYGAVNFYWSWQEKSKGSQASPQVERRESAPYAAKTGNDPDRAGTPAPIGALNDPRRLAKPGKLDEVSERTRSEMRKRYA